MEQPIGSLTPGEVRRSIRSGQWKKGTTGACLGYVQANLVILPSALADDFRRLCTANPRALPLLEMTKPGDATSLISATDADIRTDLPKYQIHRNGQFAEEVDDLNEVWRDDFVTFLLGCSYSAENQLLRAGVRLRHLERKQRVPVFQTSLQVTPVGRLSGNLVVSMRPIALDEVNRVIEITSQYPLAHGSPIHVGDPRAIGIDDVENPDWGEPIAINEDEAPVFWACGVTPQAIIREVRPPVAITHAPGHMFITDVSDQAIAGKHSLEDLAVS